MTELEKIGEKSKKAAIFLNGADTGFKNKMLISIADGLVKNCDRIVNENKKDIQNAKGNGMSDAMLDMLLITKERIDKIADGVRDVASLGDPVGEVLSETVRPNGLKIKKVRVPLGVVGVIYEARPNVTVDTAALCLKSSNAVMLPWRKRGNKHQHRTGGSYALCA